MTRDEAIAGNVRAEAARHRIKQSDVGAALGLDQSAVSRRMNGQVPFTAAELEAVAKLLDIDVKQLLQPST